MASCGTTPGGVVSPDSVATPTSWCQHPGQFPLGLEICVRLGLELLDDLDQDRPCRIETDCFSSEPMQRSDRAAQLLGKRARQLLGPRASGLSRRLEQAEFHVRQILRSATGQLHEVVDFGFVRAVVEGVCSLDELGEEITGCPWGQ